MKKTFHLLLLLFAGLTASYPHTGLFAQSTKHFWTENGSMKLSGTSTMHDWLMDGKFQVEGQFKTAEGTSKLSALNELHFLLPVENLKSDKKKLDETAYKALKTETYKDIIFHMNSATITSVQNNKYYITALGILTISGIAQHIMMNVVWEVNPDQTITCHGVQKLRMTDYQIKPPSFLGFMKTGDDISLEFTFQFKS